MFGERLALLFERFDLTAQVFQLLRHLSWHNGDLLDLRRAQLPDLLLEAFHLRGERTDLGVGICSLLLELVFERDLLGACLPLGCACFANRLYGRGDVSREHPFDHRGRGRRGCQFVKHREGQMRQIVVFACEFLCNLHKALCRSGGHTELGMYPCQKMTMADALLDRSEMLPNADDPLSRSFQLSSNRVGFLLEKQAGFFVQGIIVKRLADGLALHCMDLLLHDRLSADLFHPPLTEGPRAWTPTIGSGCLDPES